jgi:NAD(P)-dependent dehydrogenase (short-subunit alcohol dehydrogenase family)
MSRSYVVTGGGRGIGRAVVERLPGDVDHVVAIELDPAALAWTDSHPAGRRVIAVVGDAGDEAVAEQAADLAQAAGTLVGWVNNAAVFRDASMHSASIHTVLDLIALNLNPAVVGCAIAIRRFLAADTGGAIVNVSSHQARQAVPGCLPYVTAKTGIEGLTRALAVEYGSRGIRVNAVALGSIGTERFQAFLDGQDPATAARSRTRCASCARSAASGGPKKSRLPSPICSRTMRASSMGRRCLSMAVGRCWRAIPRRTIRAHRPRRRTRSLCEHRGATGGANLGATPATVRRQVRTPNVLRTRAILRASGGRVRRVGANCEPGSRAGR